jgi:YesN/AraC family two-component response regulator
MYNVSHLLVDEKLKLDLLEDICRTIYYSSGIPVSILNKDNSIIYNSGANNELLDLFNGIFEDFNKHVNKTLNDNSNEIFTYTTQYEFSFISAAIKNNGTYYGAILLGPVLMNTPSEHLINEIIKKNNMSMSMRTNLKEAFANTPIVNAPRNHYIYKLLYNVISYPPTNSYREIDESYEEKLDPVNIDFESNPIKHNFSLEQLFLNKISNGDIEKVKEIYQKHIMTLYFTSLGPDKLRSQKNTAIMFCTLIARAAITGGVDAEKALTMADFYINEIEYIFKFEDLLILFEKIIVNFTNSVLQLSGINHVTVIRNAAKYVNMHLSEPIRLNDVADYVDLSPNYFSSLFKREMNLSFADYVNQARIKESQYLLQTTNYPILDIAIAVGYNNQNYFTTMFRKFAGITPKQFRMRSAK